MKNLFLKLIVMLVMAALLVVSFAACGGNNSGKPSETTGDGGSGEINNELGLPDDLNYNGAKITIMHRGGGTFDSEFECAATSTDLVEKAVYNRNRAVENRLGVKLEYIPNNETGWQTTYLQKIRAAVDAGDNVYDIFSGPAYHITTLITDGCYYDLTTTDYFNFDKVWWARGLVDGMAIDGKVFLVTGDISLGLVKYIHCLIFNESLYADLFGEDETLYDIVKDGDWTVEKMAEVTANTYKDEDKSGAASAGDRFGYVVPNTNLIRAYIDAVNLNVLHINENGDAEVWLDNQSHVDDAISTIGSYFDTQDVFYAQDSSANLTASSQIFKEGRTLFILGRLVDITTSYSGITDFEYGIVPLPKWDADDDYGVTLCGSESTFGISSSLPKDEANRASAVMEALAYESYKNVTPEYYETALKIQYEMSNDKAVMLDYIHDGARFNPNCQLNMLLNNGDISDPKTSTDYAICYAVLHDPTGWMKLFDSSKDMWTINLGEVVDKIADQK